MPNMCSYICDNYLSTKDTYRTECKKVAYVENASDPNSRWLFCPWCGSPIVYLSPTTGRNMFSACDGCKHEGQYDDEVEKGYPSPCTFCARKSVDRYELN